MNTGLMRILVDQDRIWLDVFDDDECTAAIHRWNWLFDGDFTITGDTTKVAYMRSWLFFEQDIRTPVAFEPYTISERISNFCIFDRVGSKKSHYDFDFKSQIKRMAYDLAKNIEFKERVATGNHVVNNARALFLAGVYCGDGKLIKLGTSILQVALPKFLGNDGSLLEGSTHYHFLFNRWLLEILWVADAEGMVDIVALLKPHLSVISEASKSCLVIGLGTVDAPIIGDVSPDFSFAGLFSVAFCKIEKGSVVFSGPSSVLNERSWARMVDAKINTTTVLSTEVPKNNPIKSIGHNGWARYDIHDWTLFLNNNHGESIDRAGHFHEDFLSPVLFWKGQRAIVDIGRKSYEPTDELGQLQFRAECHSGMMINGHSPARDLPNRQNIPVQLKHFENSFKVKRVGDDLKIEASHDGFSTFNGSEITHVRSFFLKKQSFEVTDNLFGANGLKVETNFFLDPEFLKTSMRKLWIDNCLILGPSSDFPNLDHHVTLKNGAYVSMEEKIWTSHLYGESAPVINMKAHRESNDNFFVSSFQLKVRG